MAQSQGSQHEVRRLLLEIDEDVPSADLRLALDIVESSPEAILTRLLGESEAEERSAT